jgi:hypothetical protein
MSYTNRREFLRASSALALSAAVPAGLHQPGRASDGGSEGMGSRERADVQEQNGE